MKEEENRVHSHSTLALCNVSDTTPCFQPTSSFCFSTTCSASQLTFTTRSSTTRESASIASRINLLPSKSPSAMRNYSCATSLSSSSLSCCHHDHRYYQLKPAAPHCYRIRHFTCYIQVYISVYSSSHDRAPRPMLGSSYKVIEPLKRAECTTFSTKRVHHASRASCSSATLHLIEGIYKSLWPDASHAEVAPARGTHPPLQTRKPLTLSPTAPPTSAQAKAANLDAHHISFPIIYSSFSTRT